MKRVITYLFLGAFLLHSTSQIVVYFNFWLNQEYISKNLCENKDKPVMQCNGKCHLKKELEKEENRKQDNKQQIEILLFTPSETSLEVEPVNSIFIEKQKNNAFETQQKTNGYSVSIFHPPIV